MKRDHFFTADDPNRRPRRALSALLGLLLLASCATAPETPRQDAQAKGTAQTAEAPRRGQSLTPEQQKVRQQTTRAVDADIDGYVAGYVKAVSTERNKRGAVTAAGVSDIRTAMTRGPLTISADDMRDLFPQYAKSAATRSVHSVSVHPTVKANALELYGRALAIDDPAARTS